jgi:hypothetical protein
VPISDRTELINKKFNLVPYLNSSLFEISDLESETIKINSLDNDAPIELYKNTVLKDKSGKKRGEKLSVLHYLFEFLDAYDFTSEGKEEIQEDKKTLINASVLGLIFEKINGYKDGSFFTPGFITMYMCRETLRRAVIHKFNDKYTWKCNTLDDVQNHLAPRRNTADILEFNSVINSIKICDPAVGSGHFLVSALNELIAIKSELGLLADSTGTVLSGYEAKVENDELIITYSNGEDIFEYHPPKNSNLSSRPKGRDLSSNKIQRVQETLFCEKQTIIENCLFGVDINPNSVKIARLRLWIELLKNAYYTKDSNYTELETLPNIDINIKEGNSLISKFDVNDNIFPSGERALFENYKIDVLAYKDAQDREARHALKSSIERLKNKFKGFYKDPVFSDKQKLNKLVEKLQHLNTETIFDTDLSVEEKKTIKVKTEALGKEIEELSLKVKSKELEYEQIYSDAFEWRFEFPEVLDDDGKFIGFDVVIGNPPYIYRNSEIEKLKWYFDKNYFNSSGNYDLYKFFIERTCHIAKGYGYICLITNSSFLIQSSFKKTREFILRNSSINILAPLGPNIFEEATVDTVIVILNKHVSTKNEIDILINYGLQQIGVLKSYKISQERFNNNSDFVFDYLVDENAHKLVKRLFDEFPLIEKGFEFGVGINTGYIKSELSSAQRINSKYHPMVAGTGISRYGKIKTDGFIMYDKEFVRSKEELGRTLPDERFFINHKILVVRTRNLSLKQRIIATIDTNKNYNLNRLSNIIARKKYNLYGLLGILNSTLFNWLYSTRFLDYEIKPIYIRNSPLAETNNKDLVLIVKNVLSIKKNNPQADTSSLESEIDKLVYQLYGLTEEEIKIVEGMQ